MIKNRSILAKYKIVFGLLGLSAITTEIIALVSNDTFVPTNFFSFFTIESNLFAAVILILSAIFIIRKKSFAQFDLLRGAATLYMVTTGIVFSILLAGIENSVLTAVPWDNTVLHYIMPIVLIADWILDPPKKAITFKRALLWLIFPLVYVTYSLMRGAIVNWYPYPFLNPASNGYFGVLITSLGITATVLVLTWVLIRLSKKTA
ncbi:hypothetical protein EPN95_03075 [Patescibacteria group bacterium]|nr:MAG: hypothetical protein EPN95_03075 [Patescibacteria group bacterium]